MASERENQGTPSLRLEKVTAVYPQPGSTQEHPLREASLSLFPGDLLAILGPNGAGKSTLLRVLSGVLAPRSGRAEIFGTSIDARDRREVARAIAVVTQVSEVSSGFTVREVVQMGRSPFQDGWLRPSAEDEQLVNDVIRRTSLETLSDRSVDTLSGGEQKRVAIARALAQSPKILLLDEPGAFLDVHHQTALYELLAEEVARSKLACAVVMHDLNCAALYATRVALMSKGSIVAEGSVDQVMTYARLKETYGVDLYCGVNDLDGARFFLPMRQR